MNQLLYIIQIAQLEKKFGFSVLTHRSCSGELPSFIFATRLSSSVQHL